MESSIALTKILDLLVFWCIDSHKSNESNFLMEGLE
jgi:hypothetical protein